MKKIDEFTFSNDTALTRHEFLTEVLDAAKSRGDYLFQLVKAIGIRGYISVNCLGIYVVDVYGDYLNQEEVPLVKCKEKVYLLWEVQGPSPVGKTKLIGIYDTKEKADFTAGELVKQVPYYLRPEYDSGGLVFGISYEVYENEVQ
jgi:hypothetical protein